MKLQGKQPNKKRSGFGTEESVSKPLLQCKEEKSMRPKTKLKWLYSILILTAVIAGCSEEKPQAQLSEIPEATAQVTAATTEPEETTVTTTAPIETTGVTEHRTELVEPQPPGNRTAHYHTTGNSACGNCTANYNATCTRTTNNRTYHTTDGGEHHRNDTPNRANRTSQRSD